MTTLARVVAGRVVFAGALLAVACQKDDNALFDNSNLGDTAGSAGANASGAQSSGASSAGGSTGATSTGGTEATDAAESGTGAQAAGGTGGAGGAGEQGGSAGSAGSGGKAEEGGSAGHGGTAGNAGSGGTKPDPEPEPVTVDLTDFEDAQINSCAQYSNYGSGEVINIDADASNCIYQAVMRVALDEIPEGAVVSKATLTLTCTDVGEAIDLSYVEQAWSEDEVRWNNRPNAAESSLGSMSCAALGPFSVDLKAAVVAWLAGDHHNYGFYLRTESDSGTDFASSENDTVASRPVLSVTYTLPIK